jgi:hypothetical protein
MKAKVDMAELRESRERRLNSREAQVLIRRAVLQATGGGESCKLAFQLATVAEAQDEGLAMAWTSETSRSSCNESETGPDDFVEGKRACGLAGRVADALPRCDSKGREASGRVTIDNLQTLLKSTDMEVDTEGGGDRCDSIGTTVATEKVRIADLPDLLHSRPERE